MSQAEQPLPDYEKWQCNSEDKKVRVEVSEIVDGSLKFIEIPTTEVETFIAEEGVADISRFTRVYFPIEWMGESVVSLIDSWGSSDGDHDEAYDLVKVWWRDHKNDWVLTQTGFIRGVGGAATNGVGRLIVQGPEALTTAIPVSKKFQELDDTKVAQYVTSVMQQTRYGSSGFEIQGVSPTAGEKSWYVDDTSPALREGDSFGERFVTSVSLGADTLVSGLSQASTINIVQNMYDGGVNPFSQTASEIEQGFGSSKATQKQFKANRDVLSDVLDFYAKKTDSEWFFDERGHLVIDRDPYTRRVHFIGNSLMSDVDLSDNEELIRAEVLKNNALNEISPINMVNVRGSTTISIEGYNLSMVPEFGHGNKYPSAAAWYPPFMANKEATFEEVKRPEGTAGVGNVLETDDKTLKEAESTAQKALQNSIMDTGEGEIELKGNPYITPQDMITALPTDCTQGTIEDATAYQITEVKHHQKEGGFYKTQLRVKAHVNPAKVKTASTMEDA